MNALLGARVNAPFMAARPQQASFSRSSMLSAPGRTFARTQRGALQVVAADRDGEEKKPVVKKKLPSPVKRAMLAGQRRLINRSRKAACSTRIKKVMKLATMMTSSPPATEAEVKPLELLVAEAYQEIDKAVTRGVLHRNNGARKKARVARYKRQVLMAGGFFKPLESHPEYRKYLRISAKVKVAPVKVVVAAVVPAAAAPAVKGAKVPKVKGPSITPPKAKAPKGTKA